MTLEAFTPSAGGMRSLHRQFFVEPNPGPSPMPSLFAGHIPGRVLAGFSAPADSNVTYAFPGWTEQRAILNRTVYMHRDFTPTTNQNQWLSWVQTSHNWNYTRAQGPMYPVLSFKCSSYTNMRTGSFDAALDAIRQWAKTRRTSGAGGTPQPFALTFDHEPIGNPGGTLQEWASAQVKCSNFFAGWTTNATTGDKVAYNAADDVSDIMAWCSIPNGWPWGPKGGNQSHVNNMCPPLLRQTFMDNRSVIAPDIYDPEPPNALPAENPNRYNVAYNYAPNDNRVSKRMQAFIDWTDSVGYTGAIGCSEFSALEEDEFIRAWQVVRSVRDRWGWMSHFCSQQNSNWEYRLIPANYPGGQLPDRYSGSTLVYRDHGGGSRQAARLAAYQQIIDETISPEYTGPMGG